MRINSPFTKDRFENERIHLYYLPEKTMIELEEEKPIFLMGSRGTGKTTLLNSLSWRERLRNKNLITELESKVFDNRIIGIYLKLSESHSKLIHIWLLKSNSELYNSYNSIYFDLLWIEEGFNALEELVIEGFFRCSIEQEKKFIKSIFSEFFNYSGALNLKEPETIMELSCFIKTLREKIEIYAMKESDPVCLIDAIKPYPVGYLGREIAKLISNFCEMYQTKYPGLYHIKVCYDEAEVLESQQKIVLNTAIRLSSSPLFFIISYVSNIEEMALTCFPNLTLGRADRKIMDLDNMDDSQFRSFAEGVAAVRINTTLRDQNFPTKLKSLDITSLLGRFDINRLLENILKKSENKELSQKWFKAAETYKNSPFYGGVDSEEADESLPLYQAYIVEKLKIILPSPDKQDWERRKQESAEIRKRIAASYLCMCDELGHSPFYAYDIMLLQMCDNCIRDFLIQMHKIFFHVKKHVEEFIKIKNIRIEIQSAALKDASYEKKDFIKRSQLKSPNEIERLIDGLCKATTSMHAKNGVKSLTTHERGRFVLNLDAPFTENKAIIIELIKEASEAGYLKMIKGYGTQWKFQVHASLAAAYGFSYRGSINDVAITFNDLYTLAFSYDDDQHKNIIGNFIKRISPNDPEINSSQISLW